MLIPMRGISRPLLLLFAVAAIAAVVLTVIHRDDDVTPAEVEAPPITIATPGPTAPPLVETPPPVLATPVATTAPATAATTALRPVGPPQSGHWIDVDVSNYTVRLMNGTTATRTIGPVGVGAQINTGAYESTRTGLFYVYSMDASLTYDAPYDTYISHWVGFDPGLDNGFHSFLKDAAGRVVDPSTGRISNGCIRTAEPEAIYAFAEIGMPVWVHL